ncbi:MAG: hypothetical protein H5U08_15640, partial [Thermogutta sp.]|uniref:hypothetical protein n=1 Tax=Thermogutta sp. TaxID=1962930 RepID=UPI0019BC12EE
MFLDRILRLARYSCFTGAFTADRVPGDRVQAGVVLLADDRQEAGLRVRPRDAVDAFLDHVAAPPEA